MTHAYRPNLDVSVVICAHDADRWESLTRAILSVTSQPGTAEAIVVVDHNPALLERVRRCLPQVIAVPNQQARGISGSRNTGQSIARGRIIAFLDDDAVAAPDWIAHLLHAYADGSAMAVGGRVEPLWAGTRPRWFPPEFDWVVGCTHAGMPHRAAAVRNVIGCNMSFRREVFERAGGFSAAFGRVGHNGVGCEETEFCVRVGQLWPNSIVYRPEALVTHLISPARMRFRYFRRRCLAEGRSKASLSRTCGASAATSSERGYLMRVLGPAAVREFRAGLCGSSAACTRLAAIALGLAFACAGFVAGRLSEDSRFIATTTC